MIPDISDHFPVVYSNGFEKKLKLNCEVKAIRIIKKHIYSSENKKLFDQAELLLIWKGTWCTKILTLKGYLLSFVWNTDIGIW